MGQRFEDQVVRQRQLREHDEYEHAHSEMRQQQLDPLEKRVSNLENWHWWVIGIGALLVFEIPLAVIFLK